MSSPLLLFITLLFHFHSPAAAAGQPRKAIEIIIGGNGYVSPSPDYGDCPPPPPPPEPVCPPPIPPPPPPEPVCPPPIPPPPPPSPSPPPPSYPPPPPPHPPPSPSPPPPSHPPPPPPHPPPSPTPPSPSPPPPPPPQTSRFQNERIEKSYYTIRKFRSKITKDPSGITNSWTGDDVCGTYKGFKCAVRPDINKLAVAAADFNGYGFSGPNLNLPGFLDELVDLTLFHANSNNFTGRIPAKLGAKIKYLFEIDLSNNKFSGPFPNEILDATNSTFVDLRYNFFSGELPPAIFDKDLDVLFLNNNQFSGSLPGNVGNTPAIYLTFANNQFSGKIPNSIGSSKNLLEALFLNNQFSGCLPTEIGKLGKARILDFGGNQLTGPIPGSFGCLAGIQQLNLAGNKLYGEVPEGVCGLPKIANLSLSENYFTQVGPDCRKLIKEKVLDVRRNCILDLPGQRSAAECARFFSGKHSCPDEKWMINYVPCKKGGGYSSSRKELTAAPAPAPKVYRALEPHG